MSVTTRPTNSDLASWAREYFWGLREAWKTAPWMAATWAALLFLSGFMPFGILLGSRQALHAFETGRTWDELLPSLALLVAVLAATPLLSATLNLVGSHFSDLVQEHLTRLMHEHTCRLRFSFFDTSESHDLVHRVRLDTLQQPFKMLEQTGLLLQNAILLVGVASVLYGYSGALPFLLIGSTLPGLWALAHHSLALVRHRRESAPLQRKASRDSWMMSDRWYAAEIRMYLLSTFLGRRYGHTRDDLRARRIRIDRAGWRTEALVAMAGIAGVAGGVAVMAKSRMDGTALVTDIVIAFQAFLMGQRILRSLLDNGTSLFRSGAFLQDFRLLREQPADPPAPAPSSIPMLEAPRHGIRFEGVRYRYPAAERDAVAGLDLFLPAGKITALVGPNGAGKSTLIRLVCGLVPPAEGRILLDDTELSQFDVHQLRASISVLFQSPVRFVATVRENVLWGNPDVDPVFLELAARAAGIDELVQRLPSGWDTLLGPAYGGTDLSGGEWQRLSLARAFVRNAPIAVLDEPTSELDGWMEADWFERFRAWSRDKTSILISHRFSTAMKADLIHVMEHGRIVESGSHDELMTRNGPYAKGWTDQMIRPADSKG